MNKITRNYATENLQNIDISQLLLQLKDDVYFAEV